VIFDRLRAKSADRRQQVKAKQAVEATFDGFVTTHPGTQAWVEQATGFNKASLLLVATDGEWLRRSVPTTKWAQDYVADSGLVCHIAGIDPYPQRMRDWDAAHRPPKD